MDTFTGVLEWIGRLETAWAPKNERQAIQEEGRGGGGGETPSFPCQHTDKWAKKNSGPPRAVIPSLPTVEDASLSAEGERESLEVQSNGVLLHPKRLRIFPKAQKDLDGKLLRLGNGEGPNQVQAHMLYELGEESKANRLASCAQFGHRIECSQCHKFFEKYFCGQRFCFACAPRGFRRVFMKYVPLREAAKKRTGWVLADLDFTVRNTGKLPTPEEIKAMNRHVRNTLRALMKDRTAWLCNLPQRIGWLIFLSKRRPVDALVVKEMSRAAARIAIEVLPPKDSFGYLWVDELGFNNTNLHAHGLYYGPFLAFEEVKLAWAHETGEDLRVSICSARGDFARSLYHLLKYVSKPPSDDPKRLAELEIAFSGVRRVHTMGVFYNSELTEDKEHDPADSECPCCGGSLSVVGQWCAVKELEVGGLRDIEEIRRELRRQKAFSRDGP